MVGEKSGWVHMGVLEVWCWYLRGWWSSWCNGGHTALQSDDNPAVCIKGFVVAGLATECPRVMTLFIFPLS